MFENLLVVELASVLAGPSVGMFFAELGAKVIKVENPATGGDVTRSWRLPSEPGDTDITAYFSSVNWGKQSIALDLSTMADRHTAHALIQKADICIVSYKPGDEKRFAMEYSTLSTLNPRLIYAHITGFGADSARTGYDAVVQAASGFMAMNGTPNSGPVKMPVALIDVLAAHQMKEAILLALLHREHTGKGAYLTTSLLKSGLASLVNQATNWLMGGTIPQRIGSEHPTIVPYGTIFTTADEKEIVLAVGSDQQFRSLCRILGCPEIAEQLRFATNHQRVVHRDELLPLLATFIRQYHRDQFLRELEQAHIPASGILNMQEVFDQEAGKSMILEEGVVRGVRSLAFETSFTSVGSVTPPPHLNEHRQEILAILQQNNSAENF